MSLSLCSRFSSWCRPIDLDFFLQLIDAHIEHIFSGLKFSYNGRRGLCDFFTGELLHCRESFERNLLFSFGSAQISSTGKVVASITLLRGNPRWQEHSSLFITAFCLHAHSHGGETQNYSHGD